MERKVVIKKTDERDEVYLSFVYYEELQSAVMLMDLQDAFLGFGMTGEERDACRKTIQEIWKERGIAPDELQMSAVISALEEGVSILNLQSQEFIAGDTLNGNKQLLKAYLALQTQ